MLRLYNTRLANVAPTGVPAMYDKFRRLLIRDDALTCGLNRRILWNVPDANEAFDGEFAAMSRLLSQLTAWGLAELRLTTDSEPELKEITDFYGLFRRFHIVLISTKALRAEEAADQEAEVTLTEIPDLILGSF